MFFMGATEHWIVMSSHCINPRNAPLPPPSSSLKHAKMIMEVLMTLVLFWNKLELCAPFWSFPFYLSLLMACCKMDTQSYL